MKSIMLHNTPECWRIARLGQLLVERKEKVSDKEYTPLSVTKRGIVPQMDHVAKTNDGDSRKRVCIGDFVINSRSDRKGSSGLSDLGGSVSLINIVLENRHEYPRFIHHLLRSEAFQEEFYRFGHGIVADLWTTRYSELKGIKVALPDITTQKRIADFLDRETARIDQLIEKKQRLAELLEEKRSATITAAVTKGLNLNVPMKYSGIKWIGDIPKHWRICAIKRIAMIRYGIGEPPAYREEGVPLIRATNVHAGKITPNSLALVDPNDISDKRIVWLSPGDIIVVRSGAYTGDSAIIREEHCPCIAGFDMVLHTKRCFPAFLQYALLSPYLKESQLDLEKQRAAQPHLNAEELGSCLLILPSMEEQVAIAKFLDSKIGNIDSICNKTNHSIDKLKEYRSALITTAVTGQINVDTWSRRGNTDRQLDAIVEEMGA